MVEVPSLNELQHEEQRLREEEDEEVEQKREAATRLAIERGLHDAQTEEVKRDLPICDEILSPPRLEMTGGGDHNPAALSPEEADAGTGPRRQKDFVPARLPHFG